MVAINLLAKEIISKARKHLSVVVTEARPTTQTKALCALLKLTPSWIIKEATLCKWDPPVGEKCVINVDGSVGENYYG